MKWKKQELEEMSIQAIKDHNITFITEVAAFLPIALSTFYEKGLEKSERIKDAIANERLCLKAKLKKKWAESDNATLQVALFKIIADEQEWMRLSSKRHEVNTDNTGSITFNFS